MSIDPSSVHYVRPKDEYEVAKEYFAALQSNAKNPHYDHQSKLRKIENEKGMEWVWGKIMQYDLSTKERNDFLQRCITSLFLRQEYHENCFKLSSTTRVKNDLERLELAINQNLKTLREEDQGILKAAKEKGDTLEKWCISEIQRIGKTHNEGFEAVWGNLNCLRLWAHQPWWKRIFTRPMTYHENAIPETSK